MRIIPIMPKVKMMAGIAAISGKEKQKATVENCYKSL